MPEEKDPIEEFISSLDNLDKIGEKDEIEQIVDAALAGVFSNFPCIPIDPEYRNLLINIIKKSEKVEIIFPTYAYIDAILTLAKENQNPLVPLRTAFIFGMIFEALTRAFERWEGGE